MPGRTKNNNNSGLGNTLKNRQARDARSAITNARSHEYSRDAENLSSITHERDLDEFLSSAALAELDFTAERTNLKIISVYQAPVEATAGSGPGTTAATASIGNANLPRTQIINRPKTVNPYLLTREEHQALTAKQKEHDKGLRVPRRPSWDATTSKDQLERNERESFLEWRRGLADLAENHNLLLTPFERNLQVWRQLWRVIERSHLVVQIVDARNPMTFRCKDLESYVGELGLIGVQGSGEAEGSASASRQMGKRKNLLLINKSDLLTREQREMWADYFDREGITYAFFSAVIASAINEEEAAKEAAENEAAEVYVEHDDVYVHPDDENLVQEAEEESEEEEEEEDFGDYDEEEESDVKKVEESVDQTEDVKEGSKVKFDFNNLVETEPEQPEDPRTRILSVDELEALFQRVAPPLEHFISEITPVVDKLIVGLVGYPNVGKSSTINALMGSKKVSVSSTPGHTKHFQTLALTPDLTLCDCPGLVFPQFVNTEADMVCDGVLPIDQMREYTGPVELLCQRIPREILEREYGLRMDIQEIDEGGTGEVGWEDLLSTYAIARGLTRASFGMPDTSRAARAILKDYVNARLIYCNPPPDQEPDAFMESSREETLQRLVLAEAAGKKRAPTSMVSKNSDTYVMPAVEAAEERQRQSTAKSIRASAASAPIARGSTRTRALDGDFFNETGPLPRPVAKGVLGQGLQGGYSRTVLYPHTQKLGDDGRPIDPAAAAAQGRRIDAVAGRNKDNKKHFKVKDGKKRSGRGYD